MRFPPILAIFGLRHIAFSATFAPGMNNNQHSSPYPRVSIQSMTPDEYSNGGASLSISYGYASTPFGEILIASTPRGVCSLEFADNREEALESLRAKFPNARFLPAPYESHPEQITLHLKATPFQLKVWSALLTIPVGATATYGSIAQAIGQPGASRAVGAAVGANPVALLIPCHRVILSTGRTGNYHWGPFRKQAILAWESAHK